MYADLEDDKEQEEWSRVSSGWLHCFIVSELLGNQGTTHVGTGMIVTIAWSQRSLKTKVSCVKVKLSKSIKESS